MLNKLNCFIFGHKPFTISNKIDMITISDRINDPLVSINVCDRCGKVYSKFHTDRIKNDAVLKINV